MIVIVKNLFLHSSSIVYIGITNYNLFFNMIKTFTIMVLFPIKPTLHFKMFHHLIRFCPFYDPIFTHPYRFFIYHFHHSTHRKLVQIYSNPGDRLLQISYDLLAMLKAVEIADLHKLWIDFQWEKELFFEDGDSITLSKD